MSEADFYPNNTFKPIKNFESYKINPNGIVLNSRNKPLLQKPNKKGYLRVWLNNNATKHKQFFVHRLVAETFIPNPSGLPMINHKDENKTNNSADNLEWCDNTYNQRYSHALKVNQFDLNGNFIKSWEAIADIERELGIPTTNVSKCCKKQISSIGKFIFLYENDLIDARVKFAEEKRNRLCRKVKAYSLEGFLLHTFRSVSEAALYYHFSPKSIVDCCKQRKNNNQKIVFRYV